MTGVAWRYVVRAAHHFISKYAAQGFTWPGPWAGVQSASFVCCAKRSACRMWSRPAIPWAD